MRIKLFFLLIFLTGASTYSTLMGQSIEDLVKNGFNGAYNKKITVERKPAILPGVREADVIWSKTVWRMIDLREKMNQPFYFPSVESQGRTNLINLLLKGIKENTITAFNAPDNDENEFTVPLSFDQVKAQFGAATKTISRRNFETGQMEPVKVPQEIQTDEVKQLIIKEIWYFDKQKSSLQVRIVGLCPIRLYYHDEDTVHVDLLRKKLILGFLP